MSNERLNGQTPAAQTNAAGLSRQDEENLARLEQKLQLVRDRTTAVARGYSTGLFLHGSGGIGKSYTVLNELVRLQANFKLFNSRMTGRGLYNVLKAFLTPCMSWRTWSRSCTIAPPRACCARRCGASASRASAGRWSGW